MYIWESIEEANGKEQKYPKNQLILAIYQK